MSERTTAPARKAAQDGFSGFRASKWQRKTDSDACLCVVALSKLNCLRRERQITIDGEIDRVAALTAGAKNRCPLYVGIALIAAIALRTHDQVGASLLPWSRSVDRMLPQSNAHIGR